MARRKLIAIAPLAAFAAVSLLLAAAVATPAQLMGEGYLDRRMPHFDQPPLAGTARGLSWNDLSGKIALVNVFASWCGACKAEHPMLMRLANTTGVPIYGINWKDRPGAGKVFLERFGNPYAATGDDSTGLLGAELGVTGVPETYMVDAQGRIRYRHIGPISDEVWNSILKPLIGQLEHQS